MRLKKLIRNLERLNIVFQNQNGRDGAYPDYFGENRDGYMFITDTSDSYYLWFVIEVRDNYFNVDVMKTDTVRQCTIDIEMCCNLSYKEMTDYILDTIKHFDTSQPFQTIYNLFIHQVHVLNNVQRFLLDSQKLSASLFFEKV